MSLAGLMVALLLAAVATLGLHCTAGAAETATPLATADVGGHAAHRGGSAPMAHHPITDPGIHPGSPAESGLRGLIALCVSVAVAVLLAMVRLGRPNAVEVRAPAGRLPAALRRLAWPSPDPVRLCVLRT